MLEKRQNECDAALAEIEKLAKQLLDDGKVDTIEKGRVEVCRRYPELEERYLAANYG